MRTPRSLTWARKSSAHRRCTEVRTILFFGAVAAVIVAAALVGPGALAGKPASTVTRADLRGVNFVESCRFSHESMDDPIVFPGKPGASHDHTFVANNSTDAFSTLASLRAGSTTCRKKADTAAYWMPTLYQGTAAVLPMGATIYYRRATLAQVQPFPSGFKMIAGSSTAMEPQDTRITYWNCGVAGGVPPSSTVPTCPATQGSFLRLHVRFPSCWDGLNLDSTDHKSHMAYATRGACPSTHPVALPAIELIYRYPTRGGDGFTLASMGQFSAHADFFNAWNPGLLRKLVNGCLNALVHCGQGS
jgi:hypothetical protein